jgi:hypothetical protein
MRQVLRADDERPRPREELLLVEPDTQLPFENIRDLFGVLVVMRRRVAGRRDDELDHREGSRRLLAANLEDRFEADERSGRPVLRGNQSLVWIDFH